MSRRANVNANRYRLKGWDCIYCGQVATQDEHWPPVSYVPPGGCGLVLPSCAECNRLAGCAYPTNFRLRAEYVKAKIRRRYRQYDKHIMWSASELAEMSPKFQKEFKAWNAMKIIASARIAWNAEVYLLSIVPDNDFAVLRARLGFSPENEPSWFAALKPSPKDDEP